MDIKFISIEEAQQAIYEVDLVVVPADLLQELSYNKRIGKVADEFMELYNTGRISPFVVIEENGVIPIIFNEDVPFIFESFLHFFKQHLLDKKRELTVLFLIEVNDITPIKNLIQIKLRGVRGDALLIEQPPLFTKNDLP